MKEEPLIPYELVLDLSGPDGNAFCLSGIVLKIIEKVFGKNSREYQKFNDKSLSGSYEDLLRLCKEYVYLIDTSNRYQKILGKVKVTTITKVERLPEELVLEMQDGD